MDRASLRILIEMRPALAGHAGIPHETRLLFRGLAMVEGLHVEGLLQSSTHALTKGVPSREARWLRRLSSAQKLNRFARIVIMLEQRFWRSYLTALPMIARRILGRAEQLTQFDPRHFRDYIWRRLFARTLPADDFDVVTTAGFRVACVPWSVMHGCALFTRKLGYALYPRLDTSDFDVMITETPYPATVSSSTRMVVRYHDAIPMLMPHTISDRRYHQASHYRALRRNVDSGAWFACVSNATRNDLLSVFPEVQNRSLTIYNMVSHHYFDEQSPSERVPEIIKTRLSRSLKPPLGEGFIRKLFDGANFAHPISYLLMVATVEPRKNHLTLLSAWEKLRVEQFPDLKLVFVGELGWRHKGILRKCRPWMERGDAFLLEDVPSPELRLLYKHARAVVCPSLGEGFDLPGIEAMKSGGAVVASDIAVHREVYDDGAEYFNPYSVDALFRTLSDVIDLARPARRGELVSKGAIVARRYEHDVILADWHSFLTSHLARVT